MADKLRVIVLFGPTASGKTAAALRLAEELGGEIINADSRQLYTNIPIVAACPTAEEYALVPHHLFEYVDPSERYSAGMWAAAAALKINEVVARGSVPLVVGGTGFYLRALMDGVSEMPEVPAEVNDQFAGEDARVLHKRLAEVDPVLAASLNPADTQRIVRGLSVWAHTGKALSAWQEGPRIPAPFEFTRLALCPEREELHARIARRWGQMVEAGVVDEVRDLRDSGYQLGMPGLQGLAIEEIWDYLEGGLGWKEAEMSALAGTRQYAKRQVTWLRNTYKAERVFERAEEVKV
jgi:tRNA dimethylallyltransferase